MIYEGPTVKVRHGWAEPTMSIDLPAVRHGWPGVWDAIVSAITGNVRAEFARRFAQAKSMLSRHADDSAGRTTSMCSSWTRCRSCRMASTASS